LIVKKNFGMGGTIKLRTCKNILSETVTKEGRKEGLSDDDDEDHQNKL